MGEKLKLDFPVSPQEQDRLEELHSYQILDSPTDPEFDNLTSLASRILDAPIALISLVDKRRLWFKSNHGIDIREVDRKGAFCNLVTCGGESVEIPDTEKEGEEIRTSPYVSDWGIRSYLGAPLETDGGHVLGTLCVLDYKPRTFDENDTETLESLANAVMDKIELIRSKHLLEQRNEEFQMAEDFGNLGHWRIDPETEEVTWSDEVYRITGFNPEESPPDLDSALELYHPDDQEDVREAIEGAMEETKVFEMRKRLTDRTGTIHHVKIQGKPRTDESGDVTELFGVIKDVTEEVERQQRIQRNEKLASLGEMAASIMHEINNPNAVIKGNLSFLGKVVDRLSAHSEELSLPDQLHELLREDFPEVLEDLKQSTMRIERIVNDVKMFARESQSLDDDHHYACDEALVRLERIVEEFSAETSTTIEVPEEAPELGTYSFPLSKDEWTSIITNLLENALDAVEGNQESWIQLDLERVRDSLRLSVIDNGQGIPEDLKSKIPDPFFSTKGKSEGTGLGLSIIASILDRIEGDIEFETDGTPGTRVTLKVPLLDDSSPESV